MLTYPLDKTSHDPLYVQLYRGIRADIESARLAAGQRLPSKRALAAHLGVSVITVEGAFAQLTAEGYLESRPRCGFFVCASAAPTASVSTAAPSDAAGAPSCPTSFASDPADAPERHTPPLIADLTGASSAAGSFPYATWARTMRRVLSDASEATLLSSSDGRGTYRLRRAIVDHLRGFRGMDVHPDQVIVGSGAQSLYGLLVQLLGRDRTFAVEDPGYPRMARIYRAHGVTLQPIGLDEKGPLPQQLRESEASVFHCMPSHQFPTGVTTTIGRRQELLEWAACSAPPTADAAIAGSQPRYLIEDDYDCEFRMSGRPIPPLQTMDGEERVIYVNTFAKTLGPAFRIGYLVLPAHLVRCYQEQLGFYACSVGALEQLTLARFIESGDYERHVNRQRTRLRKVQDAFAKALVEEAQRAGIANSLRLRNVGAGLHFVIEAEDLEPPAQRPTSHPKGLFGDSKMTERAIAERARAHGVALAPLSGYRLDEICTTRTTAAPKNPPTPTSFVMNFASLTQEHIPPTAHTIITALKAGTAGA